MMRVEQVGPREPRFSVEPSPRMLRLTCAQGLLAAMRWVC